MTQEEKAKAYDELKVRAQELEEDGCFDKITLFDLFPELADSEDEKIRKSLIDMLKNDEKCYLKEIAWLEKQGEKKPIISDDALREGITHFGITQYQIDNWLKKYVDVEKQQKPADIIPEDFEKYVEQLLSLSDGEGHGRPAKVKEVTLKLLKLAKI